jgi:hypothetical protein
MALEKKLEEVVAAKGKVVEGQLVIWNARLEALVRSGSLSGALDQMINPVEHVPNLCDCNSRCGSAFSPEELLGRAQMDLKS